MSTPKPLVSTSAWMQWPMPPPSPSSSSSFAFRFPYLRVVIFNVAFNVDFNVAEVSEFVITSSITKVILQTPPFTALKSRFLDQFTASRVLKPWPAWVRSERPPSTDSKHVPEPWPDGAHEPSDTWRRTEGRRGERP